jgi:hypothetical protein
MSNHANDSGALRRYRTYDPPPANFDPHTAPQAALHPFGAGD